MKESDRLAAMVAGLAGNGVKVAEDSGDGSTVIGVQGQAALSSAPNCDHRIAMSFLDHGPRGEGADNRR